MKEAQNTQKGEILQKIDEISLWKLLEICQSMAIKYIKLAERWFEILNYSLTAMDLCVTGSHGEVINKNAGGCISFWTSYIEVNRVSLHANDSFN